MSGTHDKVTFCTSDLNEVNYSTFLLSDGSEGSKLHHALSGSKPYKQIQRNHEIFIACPRLGK